MHAYDGERLLDPAITTVGVRVDGELVGMGAIQEVEPGHVELKSMHVLPTVRGRGIGRAIVEHLLELARARGATRVSLETGSMEAFAAGLRSSGARATPAGPLWPAGWERSTSTSDSGPHWFRRSRRHRLT